MASAGGLAAPLTAVGVAAAIVWTGGVAPIGLVMSFSSHSQVE